MIRQLWALIEPVHDVTYFSPQARAAFEAAGLRGYWRGYFAGRAAPLGAVGAAPVTAIFYVFAPHMVGRALPDVWARAEPAAALDARLAGAVEALTATAAQVGVGDAALAEAADLVSAAAAGVQTVGRPLAAANAALPVPDGAVARLWHASTVLREHRGDGHFATLVGAGVDGCEALVWKAAIDGNRQELQSTRSWPDEEWAAATARLVERGWLDAAGGVTAAGRQRHDEVEEQTDRLATAPWSALDDGDRARLAGLLGPLSKALYDAMPINPGGFPKPA